MSDTSVVIVGAGIGKREGKHESNLEKRHDLMNFSSYTSWNRSGGKITRKWNQ
jgi:hypothetical protein